MDIKSYLVLNLSNYLDEMKILDAVNQVMIEHITKIVEGEISAYEIFNCDVPLDILCLTNYSPYMGHVFILEPNLFKKCIFEIIKIRLKLILPPQIKIQDSQIICQISIQPICNMLDSYPASGLCAVRGIVIAHSLPEKFIRTSQWKCSASICEKIDAKITKRLPSTPPLCNHCAAPLEEQPEMRSYGTKITAQIDNIQNFKYENRDIFEYTQLIIVDRKSPEEDFCLGDEINCWGVRQNESMIVWGWNKKCSPALPVEYYWKPEIMRRQLESSPWAFVQALAACIGGQTFPPHMFIHLRMGLLLSLGSLNSSQPISILATNPDTLISETLMTEAAKAAPIFCAHSSLSCLGGYIKDGTWYAGSILRASRGVCYLGEWCTYMDRKGEAAKKAIETGCVGFEGGSGENVPLKTAIWTYRNSSMGRKGLGQEHTLLKIFGLNWKTSINPEIEEEVLYCILHPNSLVPQVSMVQLREYLEAVNSRHVTLTDGALDLLKQYFVCARKIRDQNLPLRSLDLLISMTEAHARLNQRQLAYPEDAIATIYLCEHSMGLCLDIPDPPEELWQFSAWLKEHVLTII